MNRGGLRSDGRRGLRSHGSPASTPSPSNKTKHPQPSTPGADKASKVVKKSSPASQLQEEKIKSPLLPKKSIRIQLVSGNKKKPLSPKKSDAPPKKGAPDGSSESKSSSCKVMTNSDKESQEKKDPASTRRRRSQRNLDSESDTKEVQTSTEREEDHTETDLNEDKKTGVKRKASELENISVHEEKIPKSTDEKDLPVTGTTKPSVKGKDSHRNTDMPKPSGLSTDGKSVKGIKLYKMPNLPTGNQTGYKILVMGNQDPKSGQIIQTSAGESASLVKKEKEEQPGIVRTTRHSSNNQNESSKVKNEISMEVEPSSETARKRCEEASAVTLLDLFGESKEKRGPENRVRIEVVKKPDDADKGSREPDQRLPQASVSRTVTTSEKNLIVELRKLLQIKTEEIARLKNELEWKNKQLEQMEDISQRNMELESKVALLLSDKEAYSKAEEAYNKEHPTTSDQERSKRSRAKKEDSKVVDLTENNQSDEGESPETLEKPKRRRSTRRKKGEDEEKDTNIEKLLVTISSDEEEQDDKKPAKKKAKSTEEKATQGDKKQTPKAARADKEETATSKDEEDEDQSPGKGRHNIRKIYTDKKLASETKTAVIEERERLERAKQAHRKHTRVDELDKKTKTMVTTKLVLARDENDKPLVQVNSNLLQKLKPHQVDAVEFMWDTTVESLERLNSDPKGSGCILAHCMGLGKTLSVITLVHTLLKQSKHTSMATCLVVCPLNTVLNWQHEFNKWLPKKDRLTVHELSKPQTSALRCKQLLKWQEDGGVMIMGYQLFRHLIQYKGKSQKKKDTFHDTLLDPGPDLVVCDEGHILKNDASILSKCMSRIVTGRRIVLTGTPLQNNLVEYHCMVNFVKPNLLGNRREFSNRFVNPITNGQHSDSTSRDVKVMKRRAHVLHEMLNGCVQRRDYSALTKLLPMKYEYVIAVRLSEIQIKLYEGYLERCKSGSTAQPGGAAPVYTNRGASLFADYQHLMRIWTHPWVLHMEEERQERKRRQRIESLAILVSSDEEDDTDEEDSVIDVEEDEDTEEDDFDSQIDDVSEEEINFNPKRSTGRSTRNSNKESSDSSGVRRSLRSRQRDDDITTRSTRSRTSENGAGFTREPDDKPKLPRQWWSEMVTEEMEEQLELSGKLVLLMEILKMSYNIGDKVLVFSQSILSLDLIEKVLEQEQEVAESKKSKKKGSGMCQWLRDEDYHRMDGSTSPQLRKRYTSEFNNPDNKRMRLFLISTRAGGLGINLDAANRVIIFDASWNPSNDVQSIFRVYRFGQVKPVYVYRFLAQGTMEEKIYERQVTKETLSQRVIDEHQVDRHFSATDLQELYVFKPDRPEDSSEKPTPALPKDVILAELLTSQKDWISNYHEHDSLLENRPEENLTEEERKAAWEDYNKEKNMVQYFHRTYVTPQPLVSNIPGPSGGEPIRRAVTIPVGQVRPLNFGKGPSQLAATQIPRVVHEIMKYNPSISPQELQTRLSAFLGMHTPYKLNILQQGPTPNTAKLQVTGPSLPPGTIPGTKVPTTTTNLLIPINFQQTVSQTSQPTVTVPAVTQPQSATQQSVSGNQQVTQKPQV